MVDENATVTKIDGYTMLEGALAAGHDIGQSNVTFAEAVVHCNASSACSGFTFESAEAMPKTKVKIYFKNASNANTDSAWHAYLKGDQPAGRMVSSGSGGKPALGWRSTTGQAVITGNDPFALKISKVKTYASSTFPYQGRYPCGSLFYQGNWWYGTYYLVPQ